MIELTLAIAAVGAAVAGWAAWQLLRRGIHAGAVMATFERMIAQRMVHRMIKLCSAAPGTFLDAIKEAILAAVKAKTTDRVILEAEVLPAFDAKAGEMIAATKRFGAIGLFGAGMLGASCGLALNDGIVHPAHYVAAAAGAALALFFMIRPSKFVAHAALYREKVVAKLVDGFATGALSAADTDSPLEPAKAPAPAPVGPSTPKHVSLRVTREGTEVSTATYEQPVIKLGRQPRSHVVLDDDRVNRMHAVIERDDTKVQIIDLGSSTGTQVNGSAVTKHPLALGDKITIGPFELELVDLASSQPFRPLFTATKPHAPSLRDGSCPICENTEIKSVPRTDTRFTALVCAGCGYTQEFADLTKLA